MKKTICVLGGGTAGWIAASYIKQTYQNLVNVIIVYDHANPAIGVGESTTPAILDYLNVVGISYKELIKEIGATLKFGIKFTNWNGDNNRYYHNFTVPGSLHPQIADVNLVAAHEVASRLDTGAETYSSYACDNHLVPVDNSRNCAGNFALHIDALKFSEFIKSKFENSITIIDDVINEIEVENDVIHSITGKQYGKIIADIFIDSSGLSSILMNKLDNEYISKSDYVFMDSALPASIPNRINIPPYTEAIATTDGWIWKIPLQERFGAGYVYSSKFTSDQDARQRFKEHIKEVHGDVDSTIASSPIKFNPGYWKEQWKGNCVSIGLASGFVEPLEATNIHMIVTQIRMFCGNWDLTSTDWSRSIYNKLVTNMYEQTFDFIRLHYHTKREDSVLWKTVKETQPQWLIDYTDKCRKHMITSFDAYYDWDRIIGSNIFGLTAWTRVSYGLGMFNTLSIDNWLIRHNSQDLARDAFEFVEKQKNSKDFTYIKHDTFIKLTKE